jgi:hypothetical protein
LEASLGHTSDPVSKKREARRQWFMPVILATQEAEMRRIAVRSQQIVHKTLSRKYLSQKKAGGVAQSVSLELRPQH